MDVDTEMDGYNMRKLKKLNKILLIFKGIYLTTILNSISEEKFKNFLTIAALSNKVYGRHS